MLRSLIHQAIHIEISQIKCLADLAMMAPDELSRHMVLNLMADEVAEAKFWNDIDAAYRGVPLPAGGQCNTGYPMTPYPGAPYSGGSPGMIYSEKTKEESKE